MILCISIFIFGAIFGIVIFVLIENAIFIRNMKNETFRRDLLKLEDKINKVMDLY